MHAYVRQLAKNLLPAAAKYNAAAPAQEKQKASIVHDLVDQHLYADGKAALLYGSCIAWKPVDACRSPITSGFVSKAICISLLTTSINWSFPDLQLLTATDSQPVLNCSGWLKVIWQSLHKLNLVQSPAQQIEQLQTRPHVL